MREEERDISVKGKERHLCCFDKILIKIFLPSRFLYVYLCLCVCVAVCVRVCVLN